MIIKRIATKQQLERLINEKKPQLFDSFQQQSEELFFSKNITGTTSEWQSYWQKQKDKGVWFYYPEQNKLLHVLHENDFYGLRVNRNRPLIKPDLQQKLRGLTIGMVGMSVGSNIALSLLHSGIGKHFKLADPDEISLSNLNRILASTENIGQNKAAFIQQKMYDLDPYLEVEALSEGLNRNNFKSFFIDQKLDIIVDECDDILLKLYMRLAAKALKIPLLMVTDNGYTVDVEILRFHQKDETTFADFPALSFDQVVEAYQVCEQPELSIEEHHQLLYELLDEDEISEEMRQSIALREKRELVSWPQLGMVAMAGAGIGTYALVRLIEDTLAVKEKVSINLKNHF